MNGRFIVAAAGALLLSAGCASAASFDCKKATRPIEQQICKDPDLDSYDSQLEAAFQGALDRSNHPEQVKQQQLTWLKERDACADTKCMAAAYQRQIAHLSSVSDEPKVCGGASTPEVNACEAEYSHRADRELARYVAAARRRLTDEAKDDPSREAPKKALTEFDASQKAWVAYRKTECDADYDWWSESTIRGAMYETCWQTITKSRTEDIWSVWLGFMDSTPPILPKPVSVR
jgi:uncharacterized protein